MSIYFVALLLAAVVVARWFSYGVPNFSLLALLVLGTAIGYRFVIADPSVVWRLEHPGLAPPPTAQTPIDTSRTPRVTPFEARRMLDSGQAVLVDVRTPTAFANSHLDGAINIPLSEVAERYAELPRDKEIIAYCT
jgi:hypothetical protein